MAGEAHGANYPLGVVLGAKDRATGPLKSVVNRVVGVGTALHKIGETLEQRITAPIHRFADAAIEAALVIDEHLSHVRAVTGKVGQDFEALRGQVRSAARETRVGFGDAAEAVDELVTRGAGPEVIPEVLKDVLELSHATETSAATSARVVEDVLHSYQRSQEEIPQIVDLLAKGTTAAQTRLETFGSDLAAIGPTAHAVGLSLEEMVGVVGALAKGGVQSPTRVLRQILQDLAQANEATGRKSSLQEMLDVLGAARSPAELVARFGNVGKGLAVLTQAGPGGIAKFTAGLEHMRGASDMARDALDGPAKGIRELRSEIDALEEQAGENLLTTMRDVLRVARDLTHWLNELSPATRGWLLKIALGAAVVGPALRLLTAIPRMITEARIAYQLAKLAAMGVGAGDVGSAAAAGGAAAAAARGGGAALLAGLLGSTVVRGATGAAGFAAAIQTTAGSQDQLSGDALRRFLSENELMGRANELLMRHEVMDDPWHFHRAGSAQEAREVIVRFENLPAGTTVRADRGVEVDTGQAMDRGVRR